MPRPAKTDHPLADLAAAEEAIVDGVETTTDESASVTHSAADAAAVFQKEMPMNDFTAAADQAQDQAKTMFTAANDRAKDAMTKGRELFANADGFNKGNVEAMIESTKIAIKGFETMGQDAAAFARKSFEDMTAQARTLASVKSPTEFVKLQGDFARTQFDAMVAEGSKSTERMIKLAGEIAQPIQNRFAVAASQLKAA